MSNNAAIAAVTATLMNMIQTAVSADATVGSGNVTFGGFGRNLEVIEAFSSGAHTEDISCATMSELFRSTASNFLI